MIWRDFETAAPQLAGFGRARFAATQVALLGTLRADRSPRISPIEPRIVRGQLLLGMLVASQKALDVLRDARCTLHSSVSDVNGSEGECKAHGRAVLVTDPQLLNADSDAFWAHEGVSEARVFAFDIASATQVTWDIRRGEMRVAVWSERDGLKPSVQSY